MTPIFVENVHDYAIRRVQEESAIDELRVRIEYYYAMALKSACRSPLRYDTCSKAIGRFNSLIALYPGRQQYFAKNQLTLETLKATVDELLKPGSMLKSILFVRA